jgi:hypothetical protein
LEASDLDRLRRFTQCINNSPVSAHGVLTRGWRRNLPKVTTMHKPTLLLLAGLTALGTALGPAAAQDKLPANRWIELRKDTVGARRGSALRQTPGRSFCGVS